MNLPKVDLSKIQLTPCKEINELLESIVTEVNFFKLEGILKYSEKINELNQKIKFYHPKETLFSYCFLD